MLLSESESFVQPFKYVGGLGVMAEANNFYYMRARYYDPVTGRFISEDPLGFDGGDVNIMIYAGQNPVLYSDPSGEFIFSGSAAAYIFVVAPVVARYGPVVARAAQSAYLQYAPAATRLIKHYYDYEGPEGPSYYSRAVDLAKEAYNKITSQNTSTSNNNSPQQTQSNISQQYNTSGK